MTVFLRNARARNGHVEATLNHPFAAQVLLPPLRADLVERATRPIKKADAPERLLITCCVRLSDEKNPERFVRLVEHMAERKAFDGQFGYPVGLRPVLVTGRGDVNTPLVRRFLDAHPETDVYGFLDADGLERGRKRVRRWPTSKAHNSVVFH